jgi:hypothetical protein
MFSYYGKSYKLIELDSNFALAPVLSSYPEEMPFLFSLPHPSDDTKKDYYRVDDGSLRFIEYAHFEEDATYLKFGNVDLIFKVSPSKVLSELPRFKCLECGEFCYSDFWNQISDSQQHDLIVTQCCKHSFKDAPGDKLLQAFSAAINFRLNHQGGTIPVCQSVVTAPADYISVPLSDQRLLKYTPAKDYLLHKFGPGYTVPNVMAEDMGCSLRMYLNTSILFQDFAVRRTVSSNFGKDLSYTERFIAIHRKCQKEMFEQEQKNGPKSLYTVLLCVGQFKELDDRMHQNYL